MCSILFMSKNANSTMILPCNFGSKIFYSFAKSENENTFKLAQFFDSVEDVPIEVIGFLVSKEHFSPSTVSLFKSPTTVSIGFDCLNLNCRPSSISIDFEGIVIAENMQVIKRLQNDFS